MTDRTVFVNNVDTYTGAALVAELQDYHDGSTTTVLGTLKGGDGTVPKGVSEIVGRGDLKEMIHQVRRANLVVYDLHNADLDEVEMMLKAFKLTEKIEHPSTIVLVSSAMCWKRTRRTREDVPLGEDEEEPEVPEGEEPPPAETRPVALQDKDFSRRMPGGKFEHWKTLETLTMALNAKDNLKAYVVCPGILYGNGENLFNELFRAAWLCQKSHRIIGKGNNYLPLVHVRDMAACVKAVDVTPQEKKYILCVDEGNLTQVQIIQGIVNTISEPFEVPSVSETESVLADLVDVLTTDLRLAPSDIMTETVVDEETEEETCKFQWHCREGLVANLSKVASEFCKWRGLRPMRMCISGAPASGKSTVAAQLAERYNVPVVSIKPIVDEYIASLEGADEEDEDAQAAKAAWEEAQKKVTGSKTGETAHLPDDMVTPLVRKALTSNVCSFRGFVLDGFPKHYQGAYDLFSKFESSGEDEEEEEEDEDNPRPRVADAAVCPEYFIMLNVADTICKERMLAIPEEEQNGGEPRFNRRTADFVKHNLAADGSPGISNFFERFCPKTPCLNHTADADQSVEDVYNACKKFVEDSGRPFNYLPSEAELAAPGIQAEVEKAESEEAEAEERNHSMMVEEDRKRDARREVEETRRKLFLAAEEQLLEQHSAPMRDYLAKHVVPTLSDGLIEVCKVMPEDPVDYLAAYLFANAGNLTAQEAAGLSGGEKNSSDN